MASVRGSNTLAKFGPLRSDVRVVRVFRREHYRCIRRDASRLRTPEISLRSSPVEAAASSARFQRLPTWHAPLMLIRPTRITRTELAARIASLDFRRSMSACSAGRRPAEHIGNAHFAGCRLAAIPKVVARCRLAARTPGRSQCAAGKLSQRFTASTSVFAFSVCEPARRFLPCDGCSSN
jgi:hypothetical protein